MRVFFVSLLVLCGAFIFATQSYAASPPPKPSSTVTQGLNLAPLRTELTFAPGQSRTKSLNLTNRTTQPITVHLSAEKFTVVNQQYDYTFTPNSAIVKWVSFSQNDIVINPGKSQKVMYTIGVPLVGEPGGKYLSLFASTSSLSDNGEIKATQRIASLVYITVTGDITKTGKLISLKSPGLISGHDNWSMAIQNAGTTHFHSAYSVNVQTLWGSKIGSYEGDALIIPASVRSVTSPLPEPSLPGVYKANYIVPLGDTKTASETRLFVYIPLWSVGALLLLIAMVFATVVYVRSLRKK